MVDAIALKDDYKKRSNFQTLKDKWLSLLDLVSILYSKTQCEVEPCHMKHFGSKEDSNHVPLDFNSMNPKKFGSNPPWNFFLKEQ